MAVMELWRRRDLEGTVKPEYIDGNFFTQDSVGNLVGVKCYKDGAEVALTGSVTGYCVLPSGETVSVAGTRSGNQASILVPQSALAYTGPLGITLKLVDGNTITTLMRIIVVVYRSKTDTVITPSSQIITDWSNQISAALQEVEDASAAQDVKIADLKSALNNDVDDLKVANAKIEVVRNAAVDLSIVGDALTYSNDTPGAWAFYRGQWVVLTTGENTYTHMVDYAVEAGKIYRVTGSHGVYRPVATFWDSDGNMIASSGDYSATQARKDAVTMDLAVPEGATIMRVEKFGTSAFPVVYELNAENSLNGRTSAIEASLGMLLDKKTNFTQYVSDDYIYAQSNRVFWSEIVPANCVLDEVQICVNNIGANSYIRVELWKLNGDTLTKVKTIKTPNVQANTVNVFKFAYYTDTPLMVSFYAENCQARYYRTGQSGYSWKYTTNVSEETTSLSLSGLSGYSNMKLIGGFTWFEQKSATEGVNFDFFSGYLSGNLVVFGDSTVDGSSTTGHTGNVIGTDRTATAEPNAFTSILEGMIQTFTGKSTRVYNGGFGGKTLNYIADNYAGIMAAFSNVKSALLVIDVNRANGTRVEYENGIRTGLERMIALLQADEIAIAIASPQPMFFYPADNGGLPAINSAGEFAIAVNIGKDICTKYNLPFINLGEITNRVMESPYFTSDTFYGDRIHFGDGGHKFEGYELYGELIHPIIIYDGGKKMIRLESNQCELSANSGIQSQVVGGYRSIVLQATHTRTDVLARFYIINKVPCKFSGVAISGWAYNSDMYVDGALYTQGVPTAGATVQPGTHEITIKPEADKIVRFSGLIIESGE